LRVGAEAGFEAEFPGTGWGNPQRGLEIWQPGAGILI